MSPSFLFDKDGKLRLLGGASGGPIIITATAQVILNYIAKGMSLLDAVIAPRIHSQLLPNILYFENNTELLYPTLHGK
jgi:gamma-glutamyltranspeptidase